VHGDPAHVAVAERDLAGVQAGADLDAERARRRLDRERAADGARRPVEGGEEPVAQRFDLVAAEALQLAADGRMVPSPRRLRQPSPGAEPGRPSWVGPPTGRPSVAGASIG